MTGADYEILWSDLTTGDYLAIALFLVIATAPYVVAVKQQTSLALATVLSLLLVTFYQMLLEQGLFDFKPQFFLSLIPALASEPTQAHRFITAAWLHSGWIHVLGNIIVIALAGVPLEQRMGPRRWMAIYIIGLLGGNIAWTLVHPDSTTPALGASGAAFGILGAYMACWPEDRIEFPMLFFIRPWPVWMIAAFRLGLEVYNMYQIEIRTGSSNVAHMAHLGGFMLAWALARTIARGAPSPLDDSSDISIAGSSASKAVRAAAIARMGSLESDPWSEAGKTLEGESARIMRRLREEGDELETRRAWLEELAEQVVCPVCEGEVLTKLQGENCTLRCVISSKHIRWP
ncbi:MAG: hypothetical protein CXX73_05465 [Methanobacteriota archaeon]|nr:MAG: hypothetical protein CXX73_05465 [Euryarchaeota archaeon]HIN03650.1 rhomboid family intramembrane serine protease [Candidatus Poseidoniales archaeon]